jgi:hypothetical protein
LPRNLLPREGCPKKEWDFGPGGRSESHLRPDPFQPRSFWGSKATPTQRSSKKQARALVRPKCA